jgi:hypothetical protein
MEDIRSTSNEEGQESPEAREEVEALNETTNEAEAYVEKTRSYAEAEAVEGALVDLVKGSPETIDQTAPPGTSDAGVEKVEAKDDKDEVTPINLPSPKDSQIAASPLTIPQDVSEVAEGKASVSMEAPDPGPLPPPELEEEESTLGTAPSEMPPQMDKSDETVGFKWDESAMVKGSPESTEQIKSLGGSDEEALDGKGSVAKWEFDSPPELGRDEAIVGEAPGEMPPEIDRLESDEVVGWKFYKPVPAEEDLSAMIKGEMDVRDGIGKEPSDEGGGADPDLSLIGKEPDGGGGPDPDLGGIGKQPDGDPGGGGPNPDIHKAGIDPDPIV